jgi:hypothetical protein
VYRDKRQPRDPSTGPSTDPRLRPDVNEPYPVPSVDAVFASVGLTTDDIDRELAFFFRHIHGLPDFSFIHRSSMMHRWKTRTLNPYLVIALVGLASLINKTGSTQSDIAQRCIQTAEDHVLGHYSRPAILSVQILVFVVKYKTFTADYSSVFMLLAVAMRMAMALRLHQNINTSLLIAESRCRLMWSLYLLDTKLAAGYDDFTECPFSRVRALQLPSSDRAFELGLTEGKTYISSDWNEIDRETDNNALVLYIRACVLRDRVLRLTKSLAASETITAESCSQTIRSHCDEIDTFLDTLSTPNRLTLANIRQRSHLPEFGCFVVAHLTLQSSFLILLRMTLPGLRESLPKSLLEGQDPEWIHSCRQKCLSTAHNIAAMFQQLNEMAPDLPLLDIDMPVSAYQCVRILTYARTEDLVDSCTADIQSCTDIIHNLPHRYTALDAIVSFRCLCLGKGN